MIINFLRRIGFLRAVLMLASAVLAALSPFAGGHVQTSGWPLVTTLLAPIGFVVFAFMLCLDMLMTWVFMSASAGDERRRWVVILRSESVLLLILLASWTPFTVSLLRL